MTKKKAHQEIPVTLLLTACVNPNGMSYTVLNDVEKRRNQYRDALRFYLEQTPYPIVFVENTLDDFSAEFTDYMAAGRLEYITFEGNNFDQQRGKGYGEALIMLHAVEHSVLLKRSRYLVKITGRLHIANLQRIVDSWLLRVTHVFRCDFQRTDEVATVMLVAQPADLQLLLSRHLEEITENPRGYWLERVLYAALNHDHALFHLRLVPFITTPQIAGESGTFGWNYQDNYSGNGYANLYRLVNIYKTRRNYMMWFALKLLYTLIGFFK